MALTVTRHLLPPLLRFIQALGPGARKRRPENEAPARSGPCSVELWSNGFSAVKLATSTWDLCRVAVWGSGLIDGAGRKKAMEL